MKQVWIPKAGKPDVMQLKTAADPSPAAGELRVRVQAAGVNFADIMGRLGIYPDLPPMPVVVGYEVAGVVDAVGEGVDDGWLGQEVLALCQFGGYSDTVCLKQQQVFKRPDGMTAEQGAAIPVNYLTAYQIIEVMGSLKAHETILIHSAGGGVGIAAIQLAQRIGARIIGTASVGKHAQLKAMGVHDCIDYQTEAFDQRVLELTAGRGVELIVDAVGGDSFTKGLDILAPTGRLAMFGMSSAATGKSRSIGSFLKMAAGMPWLKMNPLSLINNNRAAFGVNLAQLWDEPDMVARWMQALLSYYQAGEISPVIAEKFSFEEAHLAHEYIQDRRNFGKVLLVP